MTRRRIRSHEVDLTLRLGHEHHAAGAVFYVLRKCDIPREMLSDPSARRAEGTTVVVEDGCVTTVYRNRDVRHLWRKLKRSSRSRSRPDEHVGHSLPGWRVDGVGGRYR